jgi:HEPN domain-containing protein
MKATEKYDVKNEEDFQELMESVDEELCKKGLLIFQRPLHAWLNISSRFGLNLVAPPFKKTITEGSYKGDDLTNRIRQWFDNKYGDKLKFDPTWKMAILIRGDAYRMRLPLILGAVVATCSIKNFGKLKSPTIGTNRKLPEVNILNLIDDITKEYIKNLKNEELKSIFDSFRLGNDARCELEALTDNVLIQQAKGDIDAAVSHIFTNPPQYGLSKWSSLQATEKIIKAYIEERNDKFPFGHDLKMLAEQAKNSGLREIPEIVLSLIQCPAGVRYGDPKVSLVESIQAHQACLDICLGVAKQIFTNMRSKGDVTLIPNKYYVGGDGNHTRCISVKGNKANMMFFGEKLLVEYVIDKKVWAEYVGSDIFAITQPLEERYQKALKAKAEKSEEAIRKIVPYKN